MSREEIYNEVRGIFGDVPEFVKDMPEDLLDLEWRLYKRLWAEVGPLSHKYRYLIDLALAAARGDRFGVYYADAFARAHGATDEELESVVHLAHSAAEWANHFYGKQLDFDHWKRLVDHAAREIGKRAKEERRRAA